jgi:hypothetical protein
VDLIGVDSSIPHIYRKEGPVKIAERALTAEAESLAKEKLSAERG